MVCALVDTEMILPAQVDTTLPALDGTYHDKWTLVDTKWTAKIALGVHVQCQAPQGFAPMVDGMDTKSLYTLCFFLGFWWFYKEKGPSRGFCRPNRPCRPDDEISPN